MKSSDLLTNGRYTLLCTDAGSGYSAWGDLALTRWSADAIEDAEGFFIYVRDLATGAWWSAGHQPARRPAERYEVRRSGNAVRITRLDAAIETTIEVSVHADADVETRRLLLRNLSAQPRRLEVTSYVEVALNHRRADLAHPAFSKLFVQTEFEPRHQALLARRRPRAGDERWPWLLHAIIGKGATEFETDRARFIGRGRSLAAPLALCTGTPLSATTGSVLDPIFSLRRIVDLAAGGEIVTTFLLGCADDRDQALAILRHHAESSVGLHASLRDAESPSTPSLPRKPEFSGNDPSLDPGLRRDDETRILPPDAPLRFDNGLGGFNETGEEYVVRLRPDEAGHPRLPPLPWINVIANEDFGFFVSESGAPYTWARNSRLNRLTPWYNDPVIDPYGEALYLREEDSGATWSPLPGPLRDGAACEVRHGFGYSLWRKVSHGIEQEVCQFVPRHQPLKIVRLRLTHRGDNARRLSLLAYFRLVLGEMLEDSAAHLVSEFDADSQALFARNPRNNEFADGVVFAALVAPGGGTLRYTADRASFIGRHRDPTCPAALDAGASLDGRTGAGLDPCLALQSGFELAARGSIECLVLFGEAVSREQAREIIAPYRQFGTAGAALEEARAFWRETLSAVRIETPSPEIDLMVNGWLLYQTLSCRMWGRSAFYQSGGAYGYRDQLQDSAALIYARPDLTRAQILLHAAHQFLEGDVLHWWHPPASRGLRTRFSDDLLWLAYLTAFYIEASGDAGILDERLPYLTARALAEGEDEAYLLAQDSGRSADLYAHCCASIDRSLATGRHGLPLMGSGDWNDAMNRIGREGRGESVWVGFFLHDILGRFVPLCERRGDAARARRYREHRELLRQALNDGGWDGRWYRRAWYDDGTPIGTEFGDECRIDALAQAWAVISGAAPRERAGQAMDSVERQLVCGRERIVRLLAPPFDRTPKDPGYIKGYVPGIRENGGQYTHAALWVVRALAELGRGERAAALLSMLSPICHARTLDEVEVYKLEPYVAAADVYGVAPHVGRGGWSWYTGSAAWMYRVAIESLLGFTLRDGDTLRMKPCVPGAWREFKVRYRLPGTRGTYEIVVRNTSGRPAEVLAATLDGQPVAIEGGAAVVPLRADARNHLIVVDLAPR